MKHIKFFKILLSIVAFLMLPSIGFGATSKDKGRFVVVIDPGHGGKDGGAKGHKSWEKDVVLSVAMEVGRQIKSMDPSITVYYTRDTDKFIPLNDRATFANKKKADLFVSIHANSHKTSTPKGSETYVLGLHRTQDNLEVAMKENSAILYEKDYSVSYSGFDPNQSESYIIFNFIQNKHIEQSIALAEVIQKGLATCGLGNRGVRQAGFLVLREVAMPSVLVELGFISNRDDEDYMTSKSGRNNLAKNIAKGVVGYKNKTYRDTKAKDTPKSSVEETDPPKDEKSATIDKDADSQVYYRVQVMADKRRLKPSHFGAYADEMRVYQEGGYYKYTLYNTTKLSEAKALQRKLKAKYKDCFIVGFDSDDRKVGSYY